MKIKLLTACLIIGVLGITGILAFTKTELTAEKATYHKNYEKYIHPVASSILKIKNTLSRKFINTSISY